MSNLRIILSGTSGAGKTAIARALSNREEFHHVVAVTTRGKREGDHGDYKYISEEEFLILRSEDRLLTDVEYRSKKYGITKHEVSEIEREGKIPIFTITPASAAKLIESEIEHDPSRYLSLFIDSSDLELDDRLGGRDGSVDKNGEAKRRSHDRAHRDSFTYVIDNRDLTDSVNFILALAKTCKRSGVLSARLIRLGMKCGVYIEDAEESNVEGASYDLRLGDEYFYGGRIKRLSGREPILLIEPYDYAIVTSHEVANLPANACGRFDLAVNLFAQGVILSNGPQIDPGFRGALFCLLFNTSSSPVLLKRSSHYATLELHQLIEPTRGYHGQYQRKTLLDYLPSNASRGAINELKREVEDLKRSSRSLQTVILGVISLFMAVIAVLVSLK